MESEPSEYARPCRGGRQSPNALAELNGIGRKRENFAAPQSTTNQKSKDGIVPLAPETIALRLSSSERLCSAVSQLPSRTPIRRTPLTRRMPAASSGLSKPESAASYVTRRPLPGIG